MRAISVALVLVAACGGGSSPIVDAAVDVAGRDGGGDGDAASADGPGADALLDGAGVDVASVDGASPDAADPDGGSPDAASVDGAGADAASPDAASLDAASLDAAAGPDALAATDAATADVDAPVDAPPRVYACGSFTTAPTWTLAPGFHAVVIADATAGLNQPVAVTVAGGGFGGKLYVVNQGDGRVLAIDPDTGAAAPLVAGAAWPVAPRLLTAIVHDDGGVFDGNLYVADQGTDADGDSRIYRVTPTGVATVFTAAPGPGLDDVFALAFAPGPGYPAGLYASGDTDGALPDWGVFDAAGVGTAFSEVAGTETAAVDRAGSYGGGLFAARPAGGGYAGDDSVGRIDATGAAAPRLVSALPGVHGLAFAPPGPFAGRLHAASWSSGRLISIDPTGAVADLATGLSLTNYDANILAFSPDGRVLYVADRAANRVVCIEPVTAE